MAISTKFTHSDLLAFPNDGKHRQIVDGELIVTPSPNLGHQRISRRIQFELLKYLEAHPIGEILDAPMDVILSDFDVLEPDLLLVLNPRRHILKTWVEGAPDLVIEILSPTTAAHDRGPKLKAYARFGVEEYWIVDADRAAVEVYGRGEEGYKIFRIFRQPEVLTSALLPGFALPLSDVFQAE